MGLSPDARYPQSANANSSRSGRSPLQIQDTVPKFRKIENVRDIQPRINNQPAYRRANPEGGFISPLQALTTQLPATYRICNPNFKYESSRNPRRVLTKPSKGVKNDGYDNDDSDYILYVNDILGSEETGHKNRYLILDVLGQGTFGQVVKCQNLKTQEVVAVKVVKNRTAYFNQSMMEVTVLELLNTKLDKNDDHHLLRLKDTFIHRQHLCLVFELLSVNLYELIKQNQFRGLSTTLVRVFAQQLLNGLTLLNKARLIHCDLKPENILLKNLESPIIKIIDFGSACDERQTVYTYIQSRFYRSPEVLLGLPYSSAIDMWSLGCIVVELFLGLPLFPGSSEYNQVSRITEMLGLPPMWMLEMGKQSGEFFEKVTDEYGRRNYRLKSMEQYSREHNVKEQPSKKYFQQTTLPEIIRSYAMPRKNMKPAEIERGKCCTSGHHPI
jgi:dual specificity protein kinase YAK1